MGKVTRMPGVGLSPKTLLAQTMEDVDDLAGVMVVSLWAPGGPVTVSMSEMLPGDMNLCAAVARVNADAALFEIMDVGPVSWVKMRDEDVGSDDGNLGDDGGEEDGPEQAS